MGSIATLVNFAALLTLIVFWLGSAGVTNDQTHRLSCDRLCRVVCDYDREDKGGARPPCGSPVWEWNSEEAIAKDSEGTQSGTPFVLAVISVVEKL